MLSNDIILGALIGFLSSIGIQVVIGFISQQEAKRKERHEYLRDILRSLGEARGEIQWAQIVLYPTSEIAKNLEISISLNPDQTAHTFERLQIALGKAHSLLVSIPDPYLFKLGMELMNTNDPAAQNDMIQKALTHLGKMAAVTMPLDTQNNKG